MKNFSVKKILACTLLVVALFGLCFFAVRRENKPTLAFTDFRQVASLTDKVSTVWWSDNLLLQLSKSGELFSTDLRAKTSTLLIENASLFTANAYEGNAKAAIATNVGRIYLLEQTQGESLFDPILNYEGMSVVYSLDLSADNQVLLFSLSPLPSVREMGTVQGTYLLSIPSGRLERVFPNTGRACLNANGSKIYFSPFSYAQKENGLQAYDIITHETKDISKATITNLSCSKKESLVAFTSELGALTRVYVYDEETQSMTIAYELPQYIGSVQDIWWSPTDGKALYVTVQTNESTKVNRITMGRSQEHLAWIQALGLAFQFDDEGFVTPLINKNMGSPCTEQDSSQRTISDLQFQVTPMSSKLWSVNMQFAERYPEQPSQCNWSLQFFLDMTDNSIEYRNVKHEQPEYYVITDRNLVKEDAQGTLTTLASLDRLLSLQTLTSSSAIALQNKIPNAILMQPDKQKLLVAYAGEDSDLLMFDMSATHKGVENSFKLPGEVVSVSYAAGKYVVYYIDNLEHTGNVLILGDNDLTSEVNNLLRKTIASGSSVEVPFCANETLYVPLVNTFSNVELITYLEVDLSSGLITYNFP
ncbi:MAG TPA: hypothetical protein PK519_02400 [Coprothermobacter proteolyticus]|uniref:Uncharacterized protein n=1 Tax=Coprothermobacter proteolyticus (strain ATCC 35245 / DSM 5265 / OCM 4 / BT) TaxID=309798 RepID=B5Y7V8_COPPD|nr:hypothetical protein [Coprothermobacter proteolyticus]MBP8983714.1 hypothetical protein [Coprothermobacter sp.]ACI16874.1 hypothetical protein COPRO5265_0496 [Coprothermobacter proteolyticus DSM 5265]HOK23953.1 hypothetical protein [Coprothermobacter proteolyticus]HOL53464.1 hypothetical protein [Coprothermobacter proteolyticus]HPU70226.1 hypothetical protein [Coprothermobacter proteolyticus]